MALLALNENKSKKSSTYSLRNNGKIHNQTTHVTQCINGTTQLVSINKDNPAYDELKAKLPSIDIKKIFFSKNEKFMVLITKTHAVVIAVMPGKFEVVAQLELPKVINYRNCDNNVLN